MKAPKKVIAAMAMATMIGGAVTPAFANTAKFTPNTGVGNQTPSQTTTQVESDKNNLKNAEGEIEINGTFNKYVSSLPVPTENGSYLRVTMPLALDYSYDTVTNGMQSADGEIRNESRYINKTQDINKEQPVKMTFVSMEDPSENSEFKYVSSIEEDTEGKVKLPFELVVTKNGDKVAGVHLADMVKGFTADDEPILIQPGNVLKLKIDKINGQDIKGSEVLGNGETKISNRMTLKFEYAGE